MRKVAGHLSLLEDWTEVRVEVWTETEARIYWQGPLPGVSIGAGPGGVAGKGLATLKADIGVLAAVGRLLEEQMGTGADAVTTLTASVRLLIHVSVLPLQQI